MENTEKTELTEENPGADPDTETPENLETPETEEIPESTEVNPWEEKYNAERDAHLRGGSGV